MVSTQSKSIVESNRIEQWNRIRVKILGCSRTHFVYFIARNAKISIRIVLQIFSHFFDPSG